MTRFAIKIMNKYVSKEHNENKVEQPMSFDPELFDVHFKRKYIILL